MTDRPILMSGPLVVATLAGRKTQTRRVVTERGVPWHLTDHSCAPHPEIDRCPYGVPGDRLWVREAWMPADHLVDAVADRNPPQWIRYRADGQVMGRYRVEDPLEVPAPGRWRNVPMPAKGWRPSIHMPRWASRLTLVVDAVRVERVQAISEDDARAEGVDPKPRQPGATDHYREAFRAKWDEINGKRSSCTWADNPFVWCISYHVETAR